MGAGKSSMNAMHNKMALALGVLLITTGSQSRAAGQDTTYVCSSEIEAGMIYDSSRKEWRGARLKQKQKFVLNLKFVRVQQNGPNKSTSIMYQSGLTVTTSQRPLPIALRKNMVSPAIPSKSKLTQRTGV